MICNEENKISVCHECATGILSVDTHIHKCVSCSYIKTKQVPMTTTHSTRVSVSLPKKTHKKLKKLAAELDTSMSELLLEGLEVRLKMTPNELTKKTIQDSQSGKNIKNFDAIDELFEDLGI